MAPGLALPQGVGISSCQGASHLEHQTDGNVVVYQSSNGVPLWSTITAGKNTAYLVMQTDGNLVLYGPSNEVFWASGTAGFPGAFAAVQDDCNFVIYAGGSAIWATYVICQ